MDDTPVERPRPTGDLAAAVRSARADDSKHADAVFDLRMLSLARLSVLHDALLPILAQLPEHVDLFDAGVMPGDPPRLFIDMIAFVEMARDRRGYLFFQDRRHGRVLLADCDTLDGAVDAVTAYIARRLVERERALASDVAAFYPAPNVAPSAEKPPSRARSRALRVRRGLAEGFWFVVEVLGLLALFGMLLFGLRWLYGVGRGLWPGP